MNRHRFNHNWNLADGYHVQGIPQHKTKCFGTFICGGGSTMGAKLAGFDHIGGVEIDPVIAGIYQRNHRPRYLFNEDIRTFIRKESLPDELFHIPLLEGSPPCSSFSMAGVREKYWKKKKKFAEGQAEQVLDDLLFEQVLLIERLQPQTYTIENVQGLIMGNARAYLEQLLEDIDSIRYTAQVFRLNAATMGVPQKRVRIFIIGHRKDINLPNIRLQFDEPLIEFGKVRSETGKKLRPGKYSDLIQYMTEDDLSICDIQKRLFNTDKRSGFNSKIQHDRHVCGTIPASGTLYRAHDRLTFSEEDFKSVSTFPQDYDFSGKTAHFITGMCVPPVMYAQIAFQIYSQWIVNINITSDTVNQQ